LSNSVTARAPSAVAPLPPAGFGTPPISAPPHRPARGSYASKSPGSCESTRAPAEPTPPAVERRWPAGASSASASGSGGWRPTELEPAESPRDRPGSRFIVCASCVHVRFRVRRDSGCIGPRGLLNLIQSFRCPTSPARKAHGFSISQPHTFAAVPSSTRADRLQ
jgi:hypothetical protein